LILPHLVTTLPLRLSLPQRRRKEEDWLSASVVNQHLVCDSTTRQPGFDLPRQTWKLLNSLWTGQGCDHHLIGGDLPVDQDAPG